MENRGISKYPASYGLALALTSVVNAILVVAKEKYPCVMGLMQRITFHHWVTHSAIVIVLFFGCGWLFARSNGGRGVNITSGKLISSIVAGVILGTLIIVGFYGIDG